MRYFMTSAFLLVLLVSQAATAELILGSRHQVATDGYHPRWSPDASQIAHVAGDWPDIDIYLVPAAGGERSRVPMNMGGDLSLTWRPDGEYLTFDAYNPGNGRLDIYTVRLVNGAVTRQTHMGAFGPSWSSDGSRLAFGSNSDIYSIDASGADLRRHTITPGLEYYPCWSPDGTRLAYAAERSSNTDIYIVDLATDIETRFTTDPAQDARVVWSPDGQWLAWDSQRTGVRQVYARPVAGGEDVCLTCDHPEGSMADWAPDGSAVAYVAEGGIWVLELEGIVANKPASLGSLKAMFRD
ncbi:MAG: hypothetical protein GY838_17150 [bacterium]|nr:hypothetical protein [bacterium]